MKGLTEKGILGSIRFGTALRYVFAEDVDRLLAQAAGLPELPDVGAFLPLRDHCQNQRIGLVRLITHWQEGQVGGFVRGADAIGLLAIHVPQDVDVGARDTPIATRDLTPLEAAPYPDWLEIFKAARRMSVPAVLAHWEACRHYSESKTLAAYGPFNRLLSVQKGV